VGGPSGRTTDATRTLIELAELANRLRRFRSGPGDNPAPGVERLAVAGRLVARLGGETGTTDVVFLGETAVGLALAVRQAPAAVDARLLALVADLAELLENLLGAVDEGRDPVAFLGGRDWARYRPEQDPPVVPAPGGAQGPALLLVASEFRRAALRDRFAAAGLACEVAVDPAAALARLGREPAPRWVICDDQEPLRHLSRLRELLAARGGCRPPLVLLAPGGVGVENAPEIIAARRGADRLWHEPFDPVDLGV